MPSAAIASICVDSEGLIAGGIVRECENSANLACGTPIGFVLAAALFAPLASWHSRAILLSPITDALSIIVAP